MDSLDAASFDSSSAAALGSDPGSSSDATSSDAQASWEQAMADAGVGGDGGSDDTGWDDTGSPWDTGGTATVPAPGEDSTISQAAEQTTQDSASGAQATTASADAYAAQTSLDANAMLRGMDDRQAAGPSSKGTQLACLEDACIVEGGSRDLPVAALRTPDRRRDRRGTRPVVPAAYDGSLADPWRQHCREQSWRRRHHASTRLCHAQHRANHADSGCHDRSAS